MPVPMEELLKNTNSYYRLVLAVAQRANQLVKGMPSVVVPTSKKPAIIALEEMAKGKIHCEDAKDTKAKKSKE